MLKKARDHIEPGLAMFHSFLFDDAELQFATAANLDAGCAMAYRAEAIGLYRPLAYLPAADDMKRGWEMIQKASGVSGKTQRERDYLHAGEVFYRPDNRDNATRSHDYSAQLARTRMSQDYPYDTEAAVFYSLSLVTFADSDHPLEHAEKAITILNRSSRHILITRE